jgi:hypothetical protein
MNEDWIFKLRIQRVLDSHSCVLYDVTIGHEDHQVEDTIDTVGCEYVDLVLDITGE